jgi:hypothetical protein
MNRIRIPLHRNLRLLSAGDSSFKYDLGSEEPDGAQTE